MFLSRLKKYANVYFPPTTYNTIFSLGKVSVMLYTFSHIAPYVPFTSAAQIFAGRIQPGNPEIS